VKAAIFHPAARAAIRSFPEDVRQELGKAIYDLQKGEVLTMPLSRPMPSIEPGAPELRIRDRAGIYRAFYDSRFAAGHFGVSRIRQKDPGDTDARAGFGKEAVKGVAP
jgi:phage-related protein